MRVKLLKLWLLGHLALQCGFFSLPNILLGQKFDVVVYGGTSSAIVAAVQVKRMGKSVAVVSPDSRLGGMSSNGLGSLDIGKRDVIGGIAREFYHRIWRHYQSPDAWKWQEIEDFGELVRVS